MKATYRAFVSYSHAADGKLCPAIQSALHRFAKPWYQLRAMKVFRDTASLSANPALWGSIEKALGASDYFLLLASPQSAQSPWVQREIEWWIEHRPLDRLLILLTHGDLVWDSRAGDFDWTRTTALPAALLRGRFHDVPLYVDFRWADAPEKRSLRYTQFRAAILDIAATLRGIPKDELDGEDVRQHRRTRLMATVAVTGSLTLAMVAAWQAYVANTRRREAEQAREAEAEQRRTATVQRNTALSRMLAARSLESIADPLPHLDVGLLQAVAAYRIQPTAEAQRSIGNALMATNRVKRLVHVPETLSSLALSSDGRTIATGHTRGRIVLRDAESLKETSSLDNGPGAVMSLAFSSDGRTLAAGTAEGVVLWNAENGTKGHVLAGGRTTRVTWLPEGTSIVSNGAGIVSWDTVTGAQRTSIDVHPALSRRLAVSPDGRTMATAGDHPVITLWDATTGKERRRLSGHRGTVRALEFNKDGSLLASGGSDGAIIIWDGNTGARRTTLEKHTDSVTCLAFSPDGRSLASGSDNGLIILWNLARGQPSEILAGHTNSLLEVAFNPNGRELVSVAFDQTFVVWNLDMPRHQALLRGHTADVRSVAVGPDGATLASASDDETIRLWDVATGNERVVLRGHQGEVRAIAFSPSQKVLASGGEDRTIRFWDTTDGRLLKGIDGHGQITSVAFSPEGSTLAWAAEGTSAIFVWDVAAGQEVRELAGHDTNADSLEFSRDGKVLVSGGGATIRIWDPSAGREVAEPLHVGTAVHVAISHDRRTVASSQTYPPGVLLWDLESDKDPVVLPTENLGGNNIPTFSPDGRMLAHAFGQLRMDIALVNLLNDRSTWILEGRSTVLSIAFTPDGKRLVAGHSNGHVALWDADIENWPQYACQIANRNLTREEWRSLVAEDVPYRVLCPGLAVAEK